MVQLILQIVQSFLGVYNIIILVYILSSWLPSLRVTPVMRILAGLVEPYFALFRSFPFAQLGFVSLAPLYGLLFLNLFQVMLLRMQQYGHVTIGFMLAFLVGGIWSIVSWLLGFFAIVAGIRLLVALFMPRAAGMFTQILDMLLTMSVAFVAGIFSRNRIMDYRWVLFLVVLLNVVLILIGTPVAVMLTGILESLPI